MSRQSLASADIEDPLLSRQAYRIPHLGINSFLVILAAWQRGLKVQLYYQIASESLRFASCRIPGVQGELFSIRQGERRHFFRRTLGDLTPQAVSRRCDDKQATKRCLQSAGVPVPDGLSLDRHQFDPTQVEAFLGRHPGRYFHLKPLEGSLGEGAVGPLQADEVIPAVRRHPNAHLLLEVFIRGRLWRVNVVNGRYIDAYLRTPPEIIGDGESSVRQLVEAKNRSRRHQPLHSGRVITLGETEQQTLARQGWAPDSVLPQGSQITLNASLDPMEGADILEASAICPELARAYAVRTCVALELPVGGVDLLEDDQGRFTVLEANQCPMLKGSVFPFYGPSPGNRMAEAIVDFYFPDSVDNPRHTRASFDFMHLCDVLQQGVVSDLTLPVLSPDAQHQRWRVRADDLEVTGLPVLKNILQALGLHAQMLRTPENDLMLDLVAPPDRLQALRVALQGGLAGDPVPRHAADGSNSELTKTSKSGVQR